MERGGESKSTPRGHLRSPKTLRPARRAPQGAALSPACPPGPRGAPSGLFIVESVFICFIMKINLRNILICIFIQAHKDPTCPGAGCAA